MKYEEILKSHYQEAIANLSKWVQINSVYDEKTVSKTAPFGEGVHNALEYIARLAEEKGFEVDRCDGYCTEIAFGKGPKLIGIFAHCDVVPVNPSDWTYPPFGGVVDKDAMYGRGTSDDKGPAMAAFYALCALKEFGIIKGYRVTLVIGGNEETGSRCLEYYYHVLKKPYPDYGFTPDGSFPLIYGEKGIANYHTFDQIDIYPVIKLTAGQAPNMVIDTAKATVIKDASLKEALDKSGYKYKLEEDKYNSYITIFGKPAHGSTPELGINAGLQLLDFLGNKYDIDEFRTLSSLYKTSDGKSLGEFYESKDLHQTSYNVGLINYNDMKFDMVVNFRYPDGCSYSAIVERIGAKSPFKTELLGEPSKPLLFDPKSDFITRLYNVYVAETGDTVHKPFTIGGGTYAKETKNTIAFGSEFPGTDCRIHGNDEFILIEHFTKSMALYAHAIVTLGTECK